MPASRATAASRRSRLCFRLDAFSDADRAATVRERSPTALSAVVHWSMAGGAGPSREEIENAKRRLYSGAAPGACNLRGAVSGRGESSLSGSLWRLPFGGDRHVAAPHARGVAGEHQLDGGSRREGHRRTI